MGILVALISISVAAYIVCNTCKRIAKEVKRHNDSTR